MCCADSLFGNDQSCFMAMTIEYWERYLWCSLNSFGQLSGCYRQDSRLIVQRALFLYFQQIDSRSTYFPSCCHLWFHPDLMTLDCNRYSILRITVPPGYFASGKKRQQRIGNVFIKLQLASDNIRHTRLFGKDRWTVLDQLYNFPTTKNPVMMWLMKQEISIDSVGYICIKSFLMAISNNE